MAQATFSAIIMLLLHGADAVVIVALDMDNVAHSSREEDDFSKRS
jgi:hypothetical protein